MNDFCKKICNKYRKIETIVQIIDFFVFFCLVDYINHSAKTNKIYFDKVSSRFNLSETIKHSVENARKKNVFSLVLTVVFRLKFKIKRVCRASLSLHHVFAFLVSLLRFRYIVHTIQNEFKCCCRSNMYRVLCLARKYHAHVEHIFHIYELPFVLYTRAAKS